ncbi:MAG: D-glycero-alpha-D-manno-heptose-1,7-bisphosphate 7-phosphatase [Roseiarcus sp.]
MPRSCRAVFLDRDGVLVVPRFRDGRSFAPRTLAQFAIYEDAPRCVRQLKDAGFKLVVVSNQPDVGAGLVSREVVEEMNVRLCRLMPLDAIKVCYHTKEQRCACRKPLPGLLLEAAAEMGIDLSASIMVGDRASDIEAGAMAGCRTAFVDLGYTAEARPANPDKVAASLGEATDWIRSLGSGAI